MGKILINVLYTGTYISDTNKIGHEIINMFEISSKSTPTYTNKDFMNAFLALRQEAEKSGIQDMSLDEINAEIDSVRNGRADLD